MATSHAPTLAALDAARWLVDELHHDDVAERWWGRSFDLPEGVAVELRTMGNNPERVRELVVTGDFRVETLQHKAQSEQYIIQADVWDLVFASIDEREPDRGARVDTCAQGGVTNRFIIRPEILRRPAAKASAPATPVTVDASPTATGTGTVTVIGEVVPVETFDVSAMLLDRFVDQLAVLRSGDHDIGQLLMLRPIDDASALFGAPPGFLPVLGMMVDGAVIGYVVDAEEVGRIDPRLVLYELSSDGAFPADNQYLLTTLLDRSINTRWPIDEAPDAAVALAADLGLELREGLQYPGFSYGVKRKKPLITTERYKWRNDSSGNGVMAPTDAWGTATVRRPKSADQALSLAADLLADAPAAALYCTHEALVLGNRANDAAAVAAAYAAMVGPLRALDRPRVAARADALAQM